VEQRAEPPSWLPDAGHPRTGAAADLRNPEADEAVAGIADDDDDDDDAGYGFSGTTSYPDSQDTTYGQTGTTAGGYSYDPGAAGDVTAAVPPYPASLTESAGSTSGTGSPGSGSSSTGSSSTGTSSTGRGSKSKSPESGDSPSAAKDDGRNRSTTFSAVSRGRYRAGSGSPAGAAAGGAALGGTAAAARPGTQTPARRADLVVSRLEPWSVMKFSFLMSLVAWVVLFVAVAFLYFVLSSLGVFTSIQHTLSSVTSSSGSSGTNLSHWFSASRVLGYTMLLGAVNIVLITALSTVGAMIYNLVTHLGGGIEITLRETD
jgi:Transmembrane domain of unknown function (DUF3566)